MAGGGGNQKTAVHNLSLSPILLPFPSPKPWQMYSYKDGTALFDGGGAAQDLYLLRQLNWKDNWHQREKMGPV